METNEQYTGNGNRPDQDNKNRTEQESSGVASRRQEQQQHTGGDQGSFSEQTDVTPNEKREFPTEGNPKTDFSTRPHGRTTGRMLGHEPGTEGI